MTRPAPWHQYLTRLCIDKWALDPASTIRVVEYVESLVAPGALSDGSVATVLERGGVAPAEADRMAPMICTAINA